MSTVSTMSLILAWRLKSQQMVVGSKVEETEADEAIGSITIILLGYTAQIYTAKIPISTLLGG